VWVKHAVVVIADDDHASVCEVVSVQAFGATADLAGLVPALRCAYVAHVLRVVSVAVRPCFARRVVRWAT